MTIDKTFVLACSHCSYARSFVFHTWKDIKQLLEIKSAWQSVRTHAIVKHRDRKIRVHVI